MVIILIDGKWVGVLLAHETAWSQKALKAFCKKL